MSLEPRADDGVPELTARVARAAFPKGTLAIRVRDALGPLFTDADFAGAFPARGRPAASPGGLALVLVLQFAEGLSDRQAADAVRARMDWKYLLGLELEDPGFDHTVLGDFRRRLVRHGLEERVFEAVLERLPGAGLLRAGGRQRTDSTHVLAAVRDLNLAELAGETLRAALEALAAAAPQWLAGVITREWQDRYGERTDGWRLPKGDAARREWAVQAGRDGFALLDAAGAPGAPGWLREVPAVTALRRTWEQQFERPAGEVRWREGRDLPPGRQCLASPCDGDARYGLKRGKGWTGYKAHLTETCDEDLPHLIVNVETTDATVPDCDMTPVVHARLAARGLVPSEHLADAGYIAAAHIVSARDEHAITLTGPAAADTRRLPRRDGKKPLLPQEAFAVDWDARTVTCPAGKASIYWQRREAGEDSRVRARFAAADCGPCPLRPGCTAAGRHGRTLTLLPRARYEALARARADQLTPQWKARYAARAGIEGTISQAVRVTRLRRTPYTGLAKTHLATVLDATGLNLIRADAWLTGKPLGKTRVSHLARLALAA